MSFEGMSAVLDSEADTCGFRVWAPNAGSADVMGRFGKWRGDEPPLAKRGGGDWATQAGRVGANEPHRFVIQNGSQHWRVDAYARDIAQDGDGHLEALASSRAPEGASSIPLPRASLLCRRSVG